MNKKGFVLIETIVTSVFVLGIVAFVIANILPIVGEYEKQSDYDSIESIYDAHLVRKMILKGENREQIKNLLSFPPAGKEYYLFDGTDICNFVSNINYCKTLLSRNFLDVKEIIIIPYEVPDAFVRDSKKFNRNLKEYIAQMQKYGESSMPNYVRQYEYQNRLIIEFNDGRVTNIEILYNYSSTP